MASKDIKKAKYTHWVPAAPIDPNWRSKVTHVMIDSLPMLKEILLGMGKYVAWDLETSSLDPTKGFIVGVALADSPSKGYYIPIKHAMQPSLGEVALKMIDLFLHSRKMLFIFNARFDMRFWEHSGFNCENLHVFDVQIPCWLADTNNKITNLKFFEKHFLGWQVDTFAETLGDNENFFYVTPQEATPYAAQDAVGTYALAYKTMPYFLESRQAGKLDQNMLYPLMKWEDTFQPLDADLLISLQQEVYEKCVELQHKIYSMAGMEFKINSNRDTTEVFERLGIDTGARIKSGYMEIGIPTLEKTNREHPHPILEAMVTYKKLFKVLTAYIDPLTKFATESGGGRFNYISCRVPCLTKDARVYVPGKGICSVAEVEEGDLIYTREDLQPVTWVHSHLSETLTKVTFSNGQTLTGTPHHPVWVCGKPGGWHPISDLKPGDHVSMNRERLEDAIHVQKDNTLSETRVAKTVMNLALLTGYLEGNSVLTDVGVLMPYHKGDESVHSFYGTLLKDMFHTQEELICDSKITTTFRVKSPALEMWLKDNTHLNGAEVQGHSDLLNIY